MNTKTTTIAAAILLVLTGTAGGFWLGARKDKPVDHSAHAVAPATNTAAEKKPLYWHDPMVPQQKFDQPGKSPFMDMMLVPVYADDGAGAGSVAISPRIAQNLGVRTALVDKGALTRDLTASGAVAFDERAVAAVQSRVGGTIEKLHVRAPLDRVAAGQPLAEVLAPEWVAAQQEYLALRNSTRADAALKDAARARLLVLGVPEAAIAALEADGRVRPRVTLNAPIGGVVGELMVREGMAVMPGATLFRLNGLSTVWVTAEVPEAQAAWAREGASVSLSVPAYPGEVFDGRVIALLPELNTATRTLKARIEVGNAHRKLVPGMFATVAFRSPVSRAVLRVPSEALIQTGRRSVVLVSETAEDGRARFRPVDVESGIESEGYTEIRKGLAEGARVVLSGQFLIDSEASLKASVARMEGAPAAETHKGEGKLVAVDPGTLTIQHGPIASLKMGAMTMAFLAPKGVVPAALKEGDAVNFEFTLTPKGDMALTRIAQAAAPRVGGVAGAPQ
ncbi:MAG: efflux RND transporter periplasmic adaptor subunit [Betaproteobacteria bacterium]|nr:efflux RND transporter periplasmic adaptor subunit [Betaproteobacteria bacterium]